MQLEIENYYLSKIEPTKGCLITLHNIILKHSNSITSNWKYRMPFFCFNNKMFCYLWTNKITNEPYIGFVDGNLMKHPKLVQGDRNKMKILPINPNVDIPIDLIINLLNTAIEIKLK